MKRININFSSDKKARYQLFCVVFLLSFFSSAACFYFVSSRENLLYGDAVSRLNISRKIVDNLTPGLAQLGNVWLPLPQLLMLPLIWNEYLWHSGIAATIVSAMLFIIGGIYIYKSSLILSNSFTASLFALCIYALNINILYFQTSAMSEPIFIGILAIVTYFFLLWIKSGNRMYLIPAAISVSALSLVRYEALALLVGSIPMVFFLSWYPERTIKKAESNTILYATPACLGFAVWTLYLTAIFGDPFYWKNYYAGKSIVDAKSQVHDFVYHLNYFQATGKYFTAVVWMNGLMPVLMAIISMPILIYRSIKKQNWAFLPVLLAGTIFVFMVLTLQRNTPLDQPDLSIVNILSDKTSKSNEFNIRYGLLMLPVIALLAGYLFSLRFTFIKILITLLFLVQVFSYFSPTYSVIYQLPISIKDSLGPGGKRSRLFAEWLKTHYDNGLIMISALKNDPQMFSMGFSYRTYIHEGTGKYWKESIKHPQRYAKWVVFDSLNKDDQVSKYLKNSHSIKDYYNLVYENDGILIYKIKTKPDFEIK